MDVYSPTIRGRPARELQNVFISTIEQIQITVNQTFSADK